MRKPLPREFFDRPALAVARDLLGKYLVVRRRGRTEVRMITDVEAYVGPRDRASHASRGRTPRNAPMFGKPGRWYVYLVYGMHWMLNAVTGPEGHPAAVLIRGVEGARGPARLTRALGVDRGYNENAINRRSGLWIEDRGERLPLGSVRRGPRIGVDYAGEWAGKPYRFFIKEER